MFKFLESTSDSPSYRPLDPQTGYKPLDFGGVGINGSLTQDGRIIAINFYNREHGYASLTSVAPFPEEQRYNADAVRAYRAGLVHQDGFGISFESTVVEQQAFLIEDAIPLIRLTLENGTVAETVTFVPVDSPVGVVQLWQFSSPETRVHWRGNVWLQRCAYSQLTEGGPVTMPPVTTRIVDTGYTEYIGLENRVLGSAVYLTAQAGIKRDDGGVDLGGSYNGSSLVLVFACGDNAAEAAHHLDQLKRAAPDQLARDAVHVWPARWQNVPADPILRRGLAYGLNCCVPLEDDTTCIITDHMLLPLAWNRDAYYVARGLLNWGIPESVEHVRRHILWMFERADRLKSGLWARSYLVNGRIKDTGYQLDQQLFPLLELVEYAAATGDLATFDRVKHHIQPVIEALLAQKAAFTWLLPTEETPGDDPIPYPYPISSHILLWHVLNELHALLPEHGYAQMARNVKEAINTHLITEHNGRRIYAYAGDGHGHHYLYHDANDIPLVMAPRWGFAETGDPVWRASMEFAFSEANPGATPGRRLGSVHSPGPWPLGEAQEIIAARAMGDKQREERISQRLARAAQWDGALSESYDETTFEVYSRHWFAWPNAMLACIDLDSG